MVTSSTVTEALCIIGEPRSGKTAALIERAAAWVQAGPSAPDGPSPFLFFCASPVTVEAVAERLSQRELARTPADPTTPLSCQHGKGAGMVTTPFHYACRVLADPAAQRVTGRAGRVLSRTEEAVFYEDLKTCGLKRRRLRELWAFLQCGLANLDDGDPAWIQTTEERAVLDRARDILVFDNAILPGEAVNLAVRALEAEPALRQRFCAPVVLADDYLLMSRASQRLANLLATGKIAVAGSEGAAPAAFEPYPCTAGFTEFEAAHAPVQRVTLEAPFRAVKRTWEAAPDLPGEMGLIVRAIAEELADVAVVTSDNPRTEDPDFIISEILPGLEGADTPYVVEPDRVRAIRWAMDHAQPKDVIILAGKGHETYQIVGHEKRHLDEREVVADYIAEHTERA